MPVINSYIHAGSAAPPTGNLLAGVSVDSAVFASLNTITRGRHAASFQAVSSEANLSTQTLSFNTLATSTQHSKRLLVFTIGVNYGSSGNITSVSYGGSSCTRAIGTASTADKGSTEIWYVTLPNNPANNNLIVTANQVIQKISVTREVLLNMISNAPNDTAIVKKNSDQSVQFNMRHPSNGVSFLGSAFWWSGNSAGNGTYPIGGATKTNQDFGDAGLEFLTNQAIYVSATQTNGKEWGNLLNGPGSPDNEMCGASWQ